MPPRGTLKSKSAPWLRVPAAPTLASRRQTPTKQTARRGCVCCCGSSAQHTGWLCVRGAGGVVTVVLYFVLPWPASGQAPLQLRGARAQLLARAFPCFRARHALVEGLPRCRGVAPVAAARGQQEPCFLSCCHPSRFLSFKVCRGPLAGGASARGTPLPPRWGATAMSTPPARACAAARP